MSVGGVVRRWGTGMMTADPWSPGAVAGDFVPDGDNTRDLGSAAASWKDLHLDGDATIAGDIYLPLGGRLYTDDDLDTFMYCSSDDVFRWHIAGADRYGCTPYNLQAESANGACIRYTTQSATNPGLTVSKDDSDNGLGYVSSDVWTAIAGGTEVVRFASNAIGFYATTPVAQQTGVAVTAAAIHAALVNLGLITA